ncbi:MAG: TIGR03067 domain-containing protein [Planctomycetes bacterium]|nr:TIGR03067 domain-containing protein [Planctomycetota bacterium]
MMMRSMVRVLIGSLVLSLMLTSHTAVAAEKADDEETERAKLAGAWKGFVVEGKGETPDRGPVKLEITVTKKTMRGIQIKDDEHVDHGEGEYLLNLASEPARLDAAKSVGRGRKQAYLGIYKLEGNTLRWCVSPQKARPETFETKKGQFLLVLRRQ